MEILTGAGARRQEQALQQQSEQFQSNQTRGLAQMAFEQSQLDQAGAMGARRRGRGLLTFLNSAPEFSLG